MLCLPCESYKTMGKSRYARLLTNHPLPIILVTLLLVVTCTLVNIFLAEPPDFSNPIEGFVPRKSKIHSSYTAWQNLIANTASSNLETSKLLSTVPDSGSYPPQAQDVHRGETTSHTSDVKNFSQNFDTNVAPSDGRRVRRWLHSTEDDKKVSFFCDQRPRDGYSKLVYAVENNSSLLSLDTFNRLCALQTEVELSSSYTPACQAECQCNSFSFVNYAAYIARKSSCHNVTRADLMELSSLLSTCHQYYKQLHTDCWLDHGRFDTTRCNVSKECANQAIYEMFHFLLPTDWTQDNISPQTTAFTVTFIHLAKGKSSYSLYKQLENVIKRSAEQPVRLYALDFGLKEFVFEEYLIKDSSWIGLALAIVLIVLWIYTESIFLTCMSLLSLVFTVIISFTLYHFIYGIPYFPFLNLLAAVVVVGTGADDLFVYWKTWTALKNGRNASILERLVYYTFKHASVAMFVTSASTATAFFASSYTDILAIRCFCIYTGTCILAHYSLVITWLPACVVLYEKYSLGVCYTSEDSPRICKMIAWVHERLSSAVTHLLKKLSLASHLWFLWLPLFAAVMIGSGLAVFYWPKLSPPSSDMFQMLSSDHPFEVYDLQVKDKFTFESYQESTPRIPLIFVFGVGETFNGRYFDLESIGTLTLQKLPDFNLPEVQVWFSNFCYDVRQQTFFDKSIRQPFGCFIEEFRAWMRLRDCTHDSLCCSDRHFPFNTTVMSTCFPLWGSLASKTKHFAVEPGVRYKGASPAAIIISFWSNMRFTHNYTHMEMFYNQVTNFTTYHSLRCPHSFTGCVEYEPVVTTSGAWLFYDIQQTLITSLPLALAIVLATSSLIIFLTTLNILLTVCALISISCSILSTLAALALMGWDLNILESVIVSLTVGLAMDYPLHVAVAYKIASAAQDRKARVLVSLHHVGGSIFAAMVTSLAAGLAMLPTHIIAYQRLGLFLIVVTISSWLSAFYLMPSLLVIIGPVGSCSQLHCSCHKKHHATRQLDKTIYSDEMSSSDVLTHTAQTLSSHITAQDDLNDDSNALELVSQTTRLLGTPSPTSTTIPQRLDTISENSLLDG